MSQSGQRLLTATEKVLRVGWVRDIYTFVAAAAVRLHLFKIYKRDLYRAGSMASPTTLLTMVHGQAFRIIT